MSKLTDDIRDAFKVFDTASDESVNAADRGADALAKEIIDEAAHECLADIRLAFEDEPDEEANLNNPIARLQERAQAKGATLPSYAFTRTGEDHTPMYECTCDAEGHTRVANGVNKQKAKRRAALGVLEAVLGVRN